MALDDNGRRLSAILDAFGIQPSAVAKVCGFSKAYVSRILSPTDPLTGNDEFWISLERNLGKLIDGRRGMVFQVGARPVEAVETVVAVMKGDGPKDGAAKP